MTINRLMQVVFVTGAVSLALPALASSGALPGAPAPSSLCGGDSDDDEDDEDDKKEGETLCGGDSDDDEDDEDDKDGTETLRL